MEIKEQIGIIRGIYNESEGKIEVKGNSKILVSNKEYFAKSYGVENKGKAEVGENATVESNCNCDNYGIYNEGELSVSGGSIGAKGYCNYYHSEAYTYNNIGIYNTEGGTTNVVAGNIRAEGNVSNFGIINNGELTIGENEGEEPSTTVPEIIGETNGINNLEGTFNFYDGIIKGNYNEYRREGTIAIYGNVTETPERYFVYTYTEEGKEIAILATGNPVAKILKAEVENNIEMQNLNIQTDYIEETEEQEEIEKTYYYFATLEAAIKACSASAGEKQTTIIMLENVEENNIIANGKNIKIELNGKTIEGKEEETEKATIENNGKLQITNQNEIGSVKNNVNYAIINNEEKDLTIGEITQENIIPSITTPKIEGNQIGIKTKGKLNFYDGQIIGKTAIKNENTNEESIKTPEQYITVISYEKAENNKEIAILQIKTEPEAKIEQTYYTTLKRAIEACKIYTEEEIAIAKTTNTELPQTEITILKDIDLLQGVETPENSNIKINMQEYTISELQGNVALGNKGTLEITGQTVGEGEEAKTGTIKGIANAITGNLKISGGEITNSSEFNYAILNAGEGTVTVSGGTVSGYSYGIYNAGEGRVEVKEGGSVSTSEGGYGIYNYGTVTVSGGTVSGGIDNYGTLTIGDNTNGVDTSKPSIISDNIGIYGSGTLNFYDGSIEGTNALDYTGTINLPTNYKITNIGTEKQKFILTPTGEVSPIATVNGVNYTSILEVLNACKENTTVTIQILENITIPSKLIITAEQTVTINLNGKTLTSNLETSAIENNGSLTINGEGIIENTNENGNAIENNGTLTIAETVITASTIKQIPIQ